MAQRGGRARFILVPFFAGASAMLGCASSVTLRDGTVVEGKFDKGSVRYARLLRPRGLAPNAAMDAGAVVYRGPVKPERTSSFDRFMMSYWGEVQNRYYAYDIERNAIASVTHRGLAMGITGTVATVLAAGTGTLAVVSARTSPEVAVPLALGATGMGTLGIMLMSTGWYRYANSKSLYESTSGMQSGNLQWQVRPDIVGASSKGFGVVTSW